MSKFSHEMELNFLDKFKANQFTTVCARIFRGYGLNSRDVISRWVRSLLNNEQIDVYRSEGLFDYIFARDTAEGLNKLAFCDSLQGIVNLGTGRPRKVIDIIEILRNYFPDMKYREVDSDILYEASVADITKLKKYINWSPKLNLEDTIPEIIEHEKYFLNNPVVLNSNKSLNILVSSSSKKISLINAVKKAATKYSKTAKVIAGDLSEEALSFFVADEFWQMPKANDENLEILLLECSKRGINAILPTRDGELEFWARNAEKFRENKIRLSNCIKKTQR